jgi:hypothetical protein
LASIVILRLDPFERMGLPTAAGASLDFYDFFVHQVWCFIYVQKAGSTLLRIPPMQKGRELQHGSSEAAGRSRPEKIPQPVRRSLAPHHPPTVVAAPDKRPGLNFIGGSSAKPHGEKAK